MFGARTEKWGHAAIETVFSRNGAKPDAIFCGNDQIARGAIDALRDCGVKVPDDVAVVGFDNWEVIEQTRPSLTTIDMELKELGRRAGLAILALTRGEPVACGVTTIPCSLVVRQTDELGSAVVGTTTSKLAMRRARAGGPLRLQLQACRFIETEPCIAHVALSMNRQDDAGVVLSGKSRESSQ